MIKLIIVNATVGIILKSLMAASPIFTIYHQIAVLKTNVLVKFPFMRFIVLTCQSDYVCNTIDAIGRNLILVNLTIPFFFFYKFDLRFKECYQKLIADLKKKIKRLNLFNVLLLLYGLKINLLFFSYFHENN